MNILRLRFVFLGALLVCLVCGSPSSAVIESGGTTGGSDTNKEAETRFAVRGRVHWKGKQVPSVKPGKDGFDRELPFECLTVNKKNDGISNFLIYLTPEQDLRPEAIGGAEHVITISNGRISPRISRMKSCDKLVVFNNDSMDQSVTLSAISHASQVADISVAYGEKIKLTMPSTLTFPVQFVGRKSSWLTCFVLVDHSGHSAISNEDGEFEIPGISPGRYRLHLYHEMTHLVKNVQINGKAVTLSTKGLDLSISNDVNVGVFSIDESELDWKPW